MSLLEEIPPQRTLRMLLGDSAEAELTILLCESPRAMSWKEIITSVDASVDDTYDAVVKFMELGALREVKPGMFFWSYGPVGRKMADLHYEARYMAATVGGYEPFETRLGADDMSFVLSIGEERSLTLGRE